MDSTKRRCENCDAYYNLNDALGECRMNPPTITHVLDDNTIRSFSGWPQTQPQMYCLKHTWPSDRPFEDYNKGH